MKTRFVPLAASFALAALAALTPAAPARACTADMTLTAIADHAAQAVIADIQSVRSYWAANPRRIETELTLTNIQYLKGGYPDAPDTMTLTVPGGAIDDWQMRLCCAPDYRPGQRWALFILPTCKVHPVVGMDRGSFRIIADDRGIERIHSAEGLPVTSIDASGVITRAAAPCADERHQHAPAAPPAQSGVRVVPAPVKHDHAEAPVADAAMSLADFRAAVAPILARSRDHNPREPAGKRVSADHRAVPLKSAAGAAPVTGTEEAP